MSKKVTLDGKYECGGGIGCWAKSFERGVVEGDVRVIGEKLMYAWRVHKTWYLSTIWWTPVDEKECYDSTKLTQWINSL